MITVRMMVTAAILIAGFTGSQAQAEANPGRLTVLANGGVTPETLPGFLRQAGHNPQKNAEGFYVVHRNILGVNFPVEIIVSSSMRKLWLRVFIERFSTTGDIPHSAYAKMMQANHDWAPNHYTLSRCDNCPPDSRYLLKVQRPMDNRSLTPETLEREIRKFIEGIEASRDGWDKARWVGGVPGAIPSSLPTRRFQ